MERNGLLCKKFALIITQKSPDICTFLFQFSTFIALIYQILPDRKSFLWLRSSREHFSQSSDYGLQWNWPNLSCVNIHPNFVRHECFPLSVYISIFCFSFHIKDLIASKVQCNAAAISLSKEIFPTLQSLRSLTWIIAQSGKAPLFARFSEDKNGN